MSKFGKLRVIENTEEDIFSEAVWSKLNWNGVWGEWQMMKELIETVETTDN